MYPIGKYKLKCTRGGSQHTLELLVVDGNLKPLLSAETCKKLQFLQVLVNDNHAIHTVVHDNITASASSDVFQEYSDVFEDIGCLEGSYHIEIDPTVKPVIYPPRRVPVTLKDPLKKELERMVKNEL